MSKKVLVICTDNVEEIECLTVADFLRRAEIEVTMASRTGHRQITGAHKIVFHADAVLEDVHPKEYDAIVLPGGGGWIDIMNDPKVCDLIRKFYQDGRLTAAICAAPGILARLGILKGKKATIYPGMETDGDGVEWTQQSLEESGNVITAQGPAKAGIFALALIKYLEGREKAEEIRRDITMSHPVQ